MARLVIFDLDGTLLDTVEDLGNATNYALRMCGFPERPLQDYYQLVGRGIYNLFRQAMPASDEAMAQASDEAMVQKMASYFLPYYGEHMCDCTKPYPGIPEMLRELTDYGIHVALASNKYQEGAEKLIRRFFPEIPFLKVLGQREGQPIKPDPQVVFQIMATTPKDGSQSKPSPRQPFVPEEVAYVGDSNVDMQTGLNAGVQTIGVTWGFRDRAELEAFHPFAVVDTIQELQALLMG
ncbi:MAG: HAD family hydrolase [Bacteroidales bacterium]|nr:HAD family hydrolase [Bacteroidales bacterium]